MSSIGTHYENPEKWNEDVQTVLRCQDIVETQEVLKERVRNHLIEIQQRDSDLIEKMEVERENLLKKDESLRRSISTLSFRMDDLNQLQLKIKQQNHNLVAQIKQMLNEKRGIAQSGTDWYVEAEAQYILMKSNVDYIKFAQKQMVQLDARIEAGKITDWTGIGMQAQAEKLLSDVYAIGLEVSESREKYLQLQKQCIELATEILERATNIRTKAILHGYHVGSDIDFWTSDGLLNIEKDVQKILTEIKSKRNDPNFQIQDLEKMLLLLESLDAEKDGVLRCALENVGRSEKAQAEVNLAGSILMNNHGFRFVGSGYENGDERMPFIARYQRTQDGMEVEFICGYNSNNDSFELIHRMNNTTYLDANVRTAIEQGIVNSLMKTGVIHVTNRTSCMPEISLGIFDNKRPTISNQTRQIHGIQSTPLRYTRHTMPRSVPHK